MAIPREAIGDVVASHPDTALVGVPVSLVREMMLAVPVSQTCALLAMPVGVLRQMLAALPIVQPGLDPAIAQDVAA